MLPHEVQQTAFMSDSESKQIKYSHIMHHTEKIFGSQKPQMLHYDCDVYGDFAASLGCLNNMINVSTEIKP